MSKKKKSDSKKEEINNPLIRMGYKLDNKLMQHFLVQLRDKHGLNYEELIKVYMKLDELVEDGVLTNDLLNYISKIDG